MGSMHLHTQSKSKNKLLLLTCMPNRIRNFILHYFFIHRIKAKKAVAPIPIFANGRHHYFLICYYKIFQLISRLKGAALCDIKTKFSTKKRNPE